MEGKEQIGELVGTDEMKQGGSSSHIANATDSFKNRITSSAFNTQTSLLNRSDFTALEVNVFIDILR